MELVLAQVLTPNASLVGHLSGIAAGLLHVYVLRGAVPGGGQGRGPGASRWLSRRVSALRNWRRPFREVSPSLESSGRADDKISSSTPAACKLATTALNCIASVSMADGHTITLLQW